MRLGVLAAGCAVGAATSALAQTPSPSLLPDYTVQYHIYGGMRVWGSELKGMMPRLVTAFQKYQPDASIGTTFMTSSEGAIAGLYTGVSEVAPAGDDAKITDMMPFYNTFHYVPTEISIATGNYLQRGALWPAAIVVNKDNPLTKLSTDQLARVFGAERTGGWDVGVPETGYNLLYTAKYARSASSNIRTWDQLGLTGEYAHRPIETFGYVAPGFKIYLERRLLHWSTKWNENFAEYVEAREAPPGAQGDAVTSERALEHLSKDRFALGWAALLHVKDYPNVKVLAIADDPNGQYVLPTADTVANRTYPLKRDAYIYVNRAPRQPLDPKVREFIRFILSRQGQQVIADQGLFYPLPRDVVDQQLRKID